MAITLPRPHLHREAPDRSRRSRRPPGFTVAAGGFYLCMAGVHIGMVGADAQVYASMDDTSPWGFVKDGWTDVFMANPEFWGLFAAALEITLGVLLLVGGRPARVGWIGIIAFQVAVLLFGWMYLWWSIPAITVLALAARHDWRRLVTRAPGHHYGSEPW